MPTPRGASFSTSEWLAAACAAAAFSAAVWLSLQPDRLADLWRVRAWLDTFVAGGDLYAAGSSVDYPPWAIVLLSPLAAIPTAILPAVWAAANTCMLGAIAWLLARRAVPDDRVTVFLLLVAAGAMRTLNQFSLLAMLFGVLSTTGPDRWKPLWLGLSLFKPQIGGVFVLIALLERRWRPVLLSSLGPIILTCAYSARTGVSLLALPLEVSSALTLEYTTEPPGQTEWSTALSRMLPIGLTASVVIVALAALAPLLARRGYRRRWLVAPVASLTAARHLSYDFVLFMPWLATLGGVSRWLFAVALMADPAGVAGLVAPSSWLTRHGDRLLLAGLWAWTWTSSRDSDKGT